MKEWITTLSTVLSFQPNISCRIISSKWLGREQKAILLRKVDQVHQDLMVKGQKQVIYTSFWKF